MGIVGLPQKIFTLILLILFVSGCVGNKNPLSGVKNNSKSNLSYEGATGTTGYIGVFMSVEPTILVPGNANSAIVSCVVKSGGASFPAWATIDQSTCTISGTPNEGLAPTIFTIVAKNAQGTTAEAALSLSVALTSPTSLTRSLPSSFLGSDTTPTILVSGGSLVSGMTVILYRNSTCTQPVGLAVSNGSSVAVTSSNLTTGIYTFYSRIVSGTTQSGCSIASVSYQLDANPPVNPVVTMALGSANPDTDSTPSFRTTLTGGLNFTNSDVVTLHEGGDITCSGAVRASHTVIGNLTSAITLTTDSTLTTYGSKNFYIQVTDAAGNSTCSATPVSYLFRPEAPANVTRIVPVTTPGNNSNPIFTVSGGGVLNDVVVTLYSDSNCSVAVSSPTSSFGTSVDVTASLSDGAYLIYAAVDNNGAISGCSTVGAAYFLDRVGPSWADSLLLNASSLTSTTTAPQATYTSDAIDNNGGTVTYQYSIGLSAGGTSTRGWTTVAVSPFTPAALTLSAGTTYYLNMRAIDEAGASSIVRSESWVVASIPALSYAASTGKSGVRGTAMSVIPSTLTPGAGANISSCLVSPALPTGLIIHNTTCVISGTPSAIISSTTYTITATNTFAQPIVATVDLVIDEQYLDSTSAAAGFGGASFYGLAFSTNRVVLGNNGGCSGLLTNCSELDTSWTPKWSTLVSYWKMNNDWIDSKGSNHGFPAGNSAFTANAKMGSHAGTFDGTSDYVAVADPGVGSNLDFASGTSITISSWVKTNAIGTWQTIISKGRTITGSNNNYSIRINSNGTIEFYFWNAGGWQEYVSYSPIAANSWYHIAVTYQFGVGSTVQLYINGVPARGSWTSGTGDVAPTITNEELRIGDLVGGEGLNGYVDDVAIWSSILSPTDIRNIYERQSPKFSGSIVSRVFDAKAANTWEGFKWLTELPFGKELPSGGTSEVVGDYSAMSADLMEDIEGLWHLNGSTGLMADDDLINDDSGNGNTGYAKDADVANTINYSSNGKFAQSINLDGVNDHIEGTIPPATFSGDFTVSAWFNRSEVTDWGAIFSNSTGGVNETAILTMFTTTNHVGMNRVGVSGDGVSVDLGADHLHKWIFVTLRRVGTTLYVDAWKDGVQISNSGTFAWTLNASGSYYIGRHYHASFLNFRGQIDEVAVWRRSLANDEIIKLYRRGANKIKFQTRACVDATCSTNPAWNGPKGVPGATNANLSYFSELHNNGSLAGDGSPLGPVINTAPDLDFINFAGLGGVHGTQFIQYRAILESDSTTIAPALRNVEIKP
jgi:hypothetical protein